MMNSTNRTEPVTPRVDRRWLIAAAVVGVAGLLIAGWADLYQHYEISVLAAAALTVARVAPLALVRFRPVAAWLVVLATAGFTPVVCEPVSREEPWPLPVTSGLIYGVVLFFAVRHVSGKGLGRVVGGSVPAPVCRGLEAGAMWLSLVATQLILLLSIPGRDGVWSTLISAAILAGILIAALALRERGEIRKLLVRERQLSATERASRELLAERARIARELHDIVAHHMSVIAVQAQSARHRISGLPPEATTEFEQIAAAARGSLTELRRMLRLLREGNAEDGVAVELEPQPGLAELPELVASTRRAGVVAILDGLTELPGLPPAVALMVYRVVQEALSNVVRHAPGATTAVQLFEADGMARIVVRNGPAQGTGIALERSGLGLLGMRERAAVHDGSLIAESTSEGGFVVELSFPLPRDLPAG